MGIRPAFNITAFNRYVDDNIEKLNRAMIRRLKYIAEKCIIEARVNKGYQDRTGNLKNSVGYVIVKDRIPIFWSDTSVGDASQEARDARETAIDEKLEDPDIPRVGLCLLFVAGMEYAAAVEALGYNVLTSAEDLAKQEVKKAIAALQKNIDNAIRRANK